MPIEIRELVIRARVEPGGRRQSAPAASSGTAARADEAVITRACVKEVLRILESRKER